MHEQKVTQSSHYSTENKRDNSDLIITGIKEDDAGIYICQINTEPIRNKVIFSMQNMFQKVSIIRNNLYSYLHSNDSTIYFTDISFIRTSTTMEFNIEPQPTKIRSKSRDPGWVNMFC